MFSIFNTLLFSIFAVFGVYSLNITVIRLEPCKLPNMVFNLTVNLGPNNFVRYGFINLTVPLKDYNSVSELEYSMDGKTFLKLATIKERNACEGLNRYIGELWYDIERHSHIHPVGGCPIKKGVYSLRNYTANLHQMTLQALPKGNIRVLNKLFDGKKVIMCLTCELKSS